LQQIADGVFDGRVELSIRQGEGGATKVNAADQAAFGTVVIGVVRRYRHQFDHASLLIWIAQW
jgi:hypothetical protein